MDLSALRTNPKTQYLMLEYDRLEAKLRDAQTLGESDPTMAELAAQEMADLEKMKAEILDQAQAIVAKDSEVA